MKFLFVFSLLLNIIFFLWEFNTGGFNSKLESEQFVSATEKQILLLSELPKINTEINAVASNTDYIAQPENALEGSDNSEAGLIAALEPNEQAIEEEVSVVVASSTDDIAEPVSALEGSDNSEADLIAALEPNEQVIDKEVKVVVASSTVDIAEPENALERDDNSEAALVVAQEPNKQPVQRVAEEIKVADLNVLKIENNQSTQEEIVIEPNAQLEIAEKKDEVIDKPVIEGEMKDGDFDSNLLEQKKSYCYQVGPFNGKAELTAWQSLNKLESASIHTFNKKLQIVSGYLVYYPAADDFSGSKKNARMLARKGITDLWLFRKGELKGVISLGLFVQEKRALSLQKELVNKGISVEIMQRSKVEKALFADISNQQEAFKDAVIVSDKQTISSCRADFSPLK